MLNRKYENLILALVDKDAPVSASALAVTLGVSPRSVKTYVKDINDLYPTAIKSDSSGYHIDRETGLEIINQKEGSIPQTSEERALFILNHLIKEPGNSYELSENLFVSMATLKNDLDKVRMMIGKYDLTIKNKNDTLTIEGRENNKRKLVSFILQKESNINFVSLGAIQEKFDQIDVFYIQEVVTTAFKNNYYFINDYSLISLILHITISVDRIKNNNATINNNDIQIHDDSKLKLAQEIALLLERRFKIDFSSNEISQLAILLMSRVTSINYLNINESNIYEYLDFSLITLVERLINSLRSVYYIDLDESEFKARFALHIKNLIIRSKNRYLSKNPLVNEIKSGCPLIYDAAVYISGIIQKETGIDINDDEIAYIAFHIGNAIEVQKEIHNKVTACLCCPNYYDMGHNLIQKINLHFSNQLLIKNIVNSLEAAQDDAVDLIISTIPANGIGLTQFIHLNIFLQQRDIDNLQGKIKEIKLIREKNEFRANLCNIIDRHLFEINPPCHTQSEIIEHSCNVLLRAGYVQPDFTTKVWEREQMSSTAYGRFAVPHTMKMEANQTAIHTSITPKPINWGEHQVQIVMLMCFKPDDRLLFNQVFEPLTRILTSPENIARLIKCRDYNEFIEILVSCL